jgi:hypothetical protein
VPVRLLLGRAAGADRVCERASESSVDARKCVVRERRRARVCGTQQQAPGPAVSDSVGEERGGDKAGRGVAAVFGGITVACGERARNRL